MSAAKYSGRGARAASANSARSPGANACTNFMGSSAIIMGRRRISVAPPSLCREDDEADFVPSAAKFFAAMAQLGRAYRPEDFQHRLAGVQAQPQTPGGVFLFPRLRRNLK